MIKPANLDSKRSVALWVLGLIFLGASAFAEETVELGTYYPSQRGRLNSIAVKESMILAPQPGPPGPAGNFSGTVYYDGPLAGLQFSDGTTWQSVAKRSTQDRFTIRMTKVGAQMLSNIHTNSTDTMNGTWGYRSRPRITSNRFLIPNWTLSPSPEQLRKIKIATISLYKDIYFKAYYAVKIGPKSGSSAIDQMFFTIQWGGRIGVDGITDTGSGKGAVYVELQASKNTTWYTGTKAMVRVGPFYDTDGSRNHVTGAADPNSGFTYFDIDSDEEPASKPREVQAVTYDNSAYAMFRIVVTRTGTDADVIMRVEDGGLWFEARREI